jgi:hypothetical protein
MDQNDLKTLTEKLLPAFGGKGEKSLYSKGRAKKIWGELCASEVDARKEHLKVIGDRNRVRSENVKEFGFGEKFKSTVGKILEVHWGEVGLELEGKMKEVGELGGAYGDKGRKYLNWFDVY